MKQTGRGRRFATAGDNPIRPGKACRPSRGPAAYAGSLAGILPTATIDVGKDPPGELRAPRPDRSADPGRCRRAQPAGEAGAPLGRLECSGQTAILPGCGLPESGRGPPSPSAGAPRQPRAGRDWPRGPASPTLGGGRPGPLHIAPARPAPRRRHSTQAARPSQCGVGARLPANQRMHQPGRGHRSSLGWHHSPVSGRFIESRRALQVMRGRYPAPVILP